MTRIRIRKNNPTRVRHLFATVALGLFAFLAIQRPAWGWNSKELTQFIPGLGLGGDDHHKMTADAINEMTLGNPDPIGYPDINKFQGLILAGASTEGLFNLAGSHKSVDNNTLYWFGNEGRWDVDAKIKYGSGQFQNAYTEFGYETHLVEDIRVPAHEKLRSRNF